MLGTASTQQLFASANSIGVIPQVWAEWNYNSFIQPMIITSGSGTNLVLTSASSLTSSAKWTSESATIAKNSTGRNMDVNSSGSSISITMTADGVNQNFVATATSASSKLTNSASPGYYKLVFYAKVNNFGSTSGTPSNIKNVNAVTSGAATASISLGNIVHDFNSSGDIIAQHNQTNSIYYASAGWTRVVSTFDTLPTTASVRLHVSNAVYPEVNAIPGQKFLLDGVILERSSSATNYSNNSNLISNYSFESGTTGWNSNQGSSISLNTSSGLFGSNCLEVTQSSTQYSGTVMDNIAVNPSTTYTFSYYVKTGSGTTNINLGGVVFFRDSSLTINPTWFYTSNVNYTNAQGWVRVSRTFTTYSDTRYIQLFICPLDNGVSGQKFLIDGVMLEASTSAGPYNLVTNSSFENGTTGWIGNDSGKIRSVSYNSLFGSNSLEVTQSGTPYSGVVTNDLIEVKPSTTYTYSYYIRTGPAYGPAADTNYYYRVVGVGNNGQTLGPDITSNSDVALITSTNSASNTITWGLDSSAAAYKIYRSNTLGEIIYLDTTTGYLNTDNQAKRGSPFYTDDLSTSSTKGSYLDNDSFNTNINLIPVIKTYDESMTQQNVFQTCKVYETNDGNPTFSTSTIDINFERWQKIEICFGVNSDDSNNYFSRFLLDLNLSANHKNAEILFTDFNLYKITEFDFKYQNIFPTESAFLPTRPGEVLLHPLLPNKDKVVKNYNTSSAKPVSFVTKIATLTTESKFPTYNQIADSDNKFKYYISSNTEEKSLQAIYDNYLSINKIVIKLDESYASFTSGSVNIYASATNTKTAISLSNADFNSNGIAVLYYSSAGWSTTPWDSPPQLTASGTLQYISSQVRAVELVCNSLSNGTMYTPTTSKGDNRIRVIELSPRLEIDLSNYTYQVSCKKDLVNTQSGGLPFSWITANSGTIEFSNIPSYRSDGYGATTFENDSKKSVFYNLMRQGVKFTAILKPSSYETQLTEKIPLFVMYSDTWSLNDLDSVSVELYDITKLFMMGSESLHYFSYDSNVITVIKEFLDYSGFSDYDYNGLYQLPEINTKVSGFWTDEQKSVFTNLQEFLLPHQIAASVDEYGILRFESLSQVFNKFGAGNFSADFAITDYPVSSIGSSSSRYIANIIPDTFSETIGQKIGAIVINYKTPLTFRSNVDKENVANSLVDPKVNTVDAPHSIWTMKESDGLSQFFIKGDFTATSRTLNVPIGQLGIDKDKNTYIVSEGSGSSPRRNLAKKSGDLLIGSEIIGYSGVEYSFQDSNDTTNKITRTIYEEADLVSALNDFQIYNSGSAFGNTSSVQYQPTGRLMNVVRGKYGTPSDELYNHTEYDSASQTPFRFFSASLTKNTMSPATFYNATSTIGTNKGNNGVLKISGSKTYALSIAQAKIKQSDYNFFSLSFAIDEGNGNNLTGYKNKKTKNTISVASYGKLSTTARAAYEPIYVLVPNNSAFGIILNTASNTTTTSPTAFCVEISQNVSGTTVTNNLIVYNQLTTKKLVDEKIDFSQFVGYNAYNPNVFDGQPHTLNLYFDGTSIVISIDGYSKRYDLKGDDTLNPASQSFFGAYIRPLESSTQTLCIYELYAANYNGTDLTYTNNRHFTSQKYLDDLINKVHTTYSYFHYASPPLARGINFYDVKLESAPVFTKSPKTISIQKISYINAGADWTQLQPVVKGDISYSSVKGSAFQQKFAIAHDGPISQGLILLNTGNAKQGEVSTSLTLLGNNMYLSEQKTLKRVVDRNYANNTISLAVDWARDTLQVEKILSNIVRANSSFNLDYSIRIFGNPLIQAGDFGQITYRLKRIGSDPVDTSIKPLVGLITSVKNTYRDGLDSTELTFKPMIIS